MDAAGEKTISILTAGFVQRLSYKIRIAYYCTIPAALRLPTSDIDETTEEKTAHYSKYFVKTLTIAS